MQSWQATQLILEIDAEKQRHLESLPPLPEYLAQADPNNPPSEERVNTAVKEMENMAYANGYFAGLDKAVEMIKAMFPGAGEY